MTTLTTTARCYERVDRDRPGRRQGGRAAHEAHRAPQHREQVRTRGGEALMPKRVQMSRQHPWRADNPDAVIVARPSKWGNPWQIGTTGWTAKPGGLIDREPHPPLTRAEAVESFRNSTEWQIENDPDFLVEIAGRDLACWCPLDQPCHADVLLELANLPDTVSVTQASPIHADAPSAPVREGQK